LGHIILLIVIVVVHLRPQLTFQRAFSLEHLAHMPQDSPRRCAVSCMCMSESYVYRTVAFWCNLVLYSQTVA